jgi:hypothetical protein
MKTKIWQKTLATMTVAGLMVTGFTGRAQSTAATPQLSFGVQQVMQLESAKISDDVVLAYIKSSAGNFGLTADQIIYLRQQGVSNPVIAAMLNSTPATVVATTAPAAAQPTAPAVTSAPPAATTTYVQPATTYVQTVPASMYYYSQPYYYPAYYPAYDYGWYPPVSLSFGWGWRGGWGGGWHGGGHGGWHR